PAVMASSAATPLPAREAARIRWSHAKRSPALAMHLETLKVFCDVVETRSFSTAASQNFVTQSAVSQQVRALEERYGRRLLERTRGNVQLTPAGEILYQVSKEIVQRYLKAYPQVHLHREYSRSTRIYEELVKGNVDLGIVAYPTRRPGISLLPFREDRLVLVCAPSHPLARHRQVSLKKLAGEPLVGYERDIPTRKETDRLLRRYGVDVRYVMELDNVETIKRVVEIGTG